MMRQVEKISHDPIISTSEIHHKFINQIKEKYTWIKDFKNCEYEYIYKHM